MGNLPSLNLDNMNLDKPNICKTNNVTNKLPMLDYSVDKPSKFEELKNIDEYSGTYETVEKMMFNEGLAKEYERIKKDYSGLINMFQQSLTSKQSSNKIISHNFNSLADFENAVSMGEFNMNDYNIGEINKLMNELEELERKVYDRDLEDYELKTVGDFHRAVDSGILNLDNYSVKEINELLSTLQDDKPLKITDYNINLYGDITIEEVHININDKYNELSYSNNSPVTEIKMSEKAVKQQANKEEQLIKSKINVNQEDSQDDLENLQETYIYQEDEEFNRSNKSFVDKMIDFIKRIFKKDY